MTSRPSVVLVASQLLTSEIWSALVDAHSHDYDFHFADHTRDDTIPAMADRLLRDSPERFDLIAHGMGGFIAFEVMRQQPGRVRSLALVNTLAANDGPAQTERRLNYIRLVEKGDFAGVAEERIPILLHPEHRDDPALLAQVRRMALATGAEKFLRQQRAIMSRIDSRPSLGSITCPVLLIWGRQDGITTQAHQTEMMATLPTAKLATIDGCGHLVTLERPQEAVRILGEWLAR